MLFARKANLDDVSIAAPCPIKWDEMEGDDRIRFCSVCELSVYNLSEMTRKDAESFLRSRSGRSCVKLYRRMDGTLITKDCPIGRRIADNVRRRVRAIAALFITILNASAVFGQQQQNSQLPLQTPKVEDHPVLPWVGVIPANNLRFDQAGHVESQQTINPVVRQGESNPTAASPSEKHSPGKTALPETPPAELKNKADATAMDAFIAAKGYESAKEPARALESYENAIHSFRTSKLGYDGKFAKTVAKRYAHLLRRQYRPQQARLIENEFCRTK
jgi:hypothetical protein